MSILLTFLSSVKSKVVQWSLIGFAITVIVWRVMSSVATSAATKEKLKQVEANLKERAANEKIVAANASTSTDALRKRMHDNWSSHE